MEKSDKAHAIDLCLGAHLMNGHEKLAREMIDMLVDCLPEHREAISNAYQNQNIESLKKAVHQLYGAVAYCGTPYLREVVTTFYQHSEKAKGTKELDKDYHALLDAMDKVEEASSL